MADVFVSYARSDKTRVAPIVAAIEAAGWSVWWDPAIEPGQEFDRQIAAELGNAAVVLVVWTPASVESRWVRGEAREAADRNKLVPVRFDGATLPIDFRALHTIDFDRVGDDPRSAQLQELLRAIGTAIARQRDPSAALPSRASAGRSIAVLPFANLTGDAGKVFLGDGLAEELIHTLARVPGLRVPSRTSSFAYRGRDIDLRRIARELEVSTVLEGSVRAAGERIRVTAQLIDGESGYHLWSQHYDRKFEDLFELQDELASAIILQTLDAAIAGVTEDRQLRAPPTRNLEAYLLYLGAVSDVANDFRARPAFEKLHAALRLDPDFARARASLVQLWSASYVFGVPLPGTLADAEQDALRVLDRAPDSAMAHASLGIIRCAQARWLEANASFQRAKGLDPSEPGPWSLQAGYVQASAGHVRANLAGMIEAVRLAPAHPDFMSQLALANALIGNDGEARRLAQVAFDLGLPRHSFLMAGALSLVELRAGRYDEAARLGASGAPRMEQTVALVFGALSGRQERATAIHALDEIRATPDFAALSQYMWRRFVIWYALLGAFDEAYEVIHGSLDTFAATGTIGVAWAVLWYQELAGFREDPRFAKLVARMRLPDYWERYGPPDGYDWRKGRLITR